MRRGGPVRTQKATATQSTLDSGPSFEPISERRIVTALSYDLVDSTGLFHRLDIEDFQELMDAFQDAVRAAIVACEGVIRNTAGDGGVALFPIELDPTDAASLAIRAGLQIVEACRRIGRDAGRTDLHVRIGVATSIAVIKEIDTENWIREPVTGAALAKATRLEAIASSDTVFVSNETRNLAGRSHAFTFQGSQSLKGFSEPEKVWRATEHKKKVDRFYSFGNLGGEFVGRLHELEKIAESWEGVVAGRGQVVLIEGDAGIGKSRLLHEVRRTTRRQRSRLFLFQCLPGGARSTLHPLVRSFPDATSEEGGQTRLEASTVAEMFMRHGVDDTEVIEIFAFLLGAEGRNPNLSNSDPQLIRERARRAVFLTLEAICRNGPVILIVEDIHWIDPSSQDLLAEAIRFIHQLPVLLLMTTRPNSSSEDLATSGATRISLRRLERDETRLAIKNKWPGNRLEIFPEFIEIAEQVSGGVPLLIEQVCQWISENADAEKVKMARTASSTTVSTFETIMDARLHRLGSARDVARAGAVAGNRFTLPLLCALLPNFGKRSLREALDTLCDAGFLSRIRLPGTFAYGFRHALIQETIYSAQLRRQRRALHRRLFSTVMQERDTAPWIDTGQLADHAERAGLLEDAIGLFVAAGKESSSISAMVEARHYLEHALALCDQLNDNSPLELLRLTTLTALGPVLTGTVGHNSPEARKLYEDGVAIARHQRMEDQSKWFPIYWGWWLSGSDFHVMRDRALQVRTMLAEVDDPEIRLQVNHCIWAIDFNMGRHRETQEAITKGLQLYNGEVAKTSRTLFGGHDAKVCGLGQLGLSLWLTGQQQASDNAISEMMRHADSISHAPSKAHAFDIAAVSAFYRNDLTHLGALTKSMGEFARQHEMKSLEGQSLLFRGWVLAQTENLTDGHGMFRNGLSLLKRLGAVVDFPLYLEMHAALLGLEGKLEEAMNVVNEAIGKALETGHAYWLAELHRRRALLLNEFGRSIDDVTAELGSAIAIAKAQGATALLRRVDLTIQELGPDALRSLNKH